MVFSLIMIGLLAAIAIRQASQGFFSALVMAVLTVCCAAAAVGTHEWVAIHWVAPFFKPDYSLAISLAVIFGIPVLLLQLLFGRLVKRSGLLPLLVDRIGGGLCGFVTALTTVGIVALSLQMLPFPNGKVLGFARVSVPDPDDPGATVGADEATERNLLLKPDRFAVALGSVLSDGVFSGQGAMHEDHPDLVEAIGWVGAVPSTVSRYAPPGSIRVEHTELVPFVYKMMPGDARNNTPPNYEPEQPMGGREFQMVRVRLTRAARDKNNSHFFSLRQFRLVGHRGEEVLEQYHPMALQEATSPDGINRHIRSIKEGGRFVSQVDKVYSPRAGGDEVEVVFDLPKGFRPSFIEYKREARATLSLSDKPASRSATTATPSAPASGRAPSVRTAEAPEASAPPAAETSGRTAPVRRGRSARGRRSGGRTRPVVVSQVLSRFGDELPLTLRAYQRIGADVARGRLRSGHLVATTSEQEGGSDAEISKFFVPPDKRLLQLNVDRIQARSGLGRALNFAAATVQNYTVQDDRGNRYVVTGKYALAKVNGQDMFEVQYFSEPVGSIGGLGKFNRIKEKELEPTDQFVLLFLVDPGVRITRFNTGGAASRSDDLTADNLVAPQ